jgi:subtilisin family serine protease
VVVIQSNDEDEPEIEVQLSGTGITDYLEIVPEEAIEFCGHPGGPFVPCSDEYEYCLTNNHSTESIAWTVESTVPWLDVNTSGGVLAPSESIYVWPSINAVGEGLPEDEYGDPCALVFTDVFTGLEQPREVNLKVFTAPEIWVVPDSFDVNVPERGTITETLTIGNTGDGVLNFSITNHEIFLPEAPAEKSAVSELGIVGETVIPEYESGKPVVSNKSFTEGLDSRVTGDAPYKEGELIVRFVRRPDGKPASPQDKQQILDSSGGGTIKRDFNLVTGLSVVELPEGVTVQEAMQRLNNTDGILYVEPNYEIKLLSRIPNDTRFNELWGMHNTGQSGGTADADIDAPEAWDIATGSSSVVVALLDTGVDYNHVDLAANIWVNSGEIPDNDQDDDGNGYVDDVYGWDFADDDEDPMDYHYHGTHTAGTIGAIGDNSEGVAGVCWEVSIMALKVFPNYEQTAFVAGAIAAIEYAVDNGARLTSNSWGGGSYSQGLKDAIVDAEAAGLLFVAAAGNDYGNNNDTYPHYPSSYDCNSIIAVMSTDHDDNMSSFSNYGPTSVDLGAPGSSILSCEPGNQYQYLDGTSMATPHVAGACALLWSVNPMLSSADLKNVLIETVDPTLAGLCVSEGRLNLFNAINGMRAPWIEIEPEAGSIGLGDSNDISVTFNAGMLAPGVYCAEIVLASNDPVTPTAPPIPVTMTVVPLEAPCDFEPDGDVDLADLAAFAAHWPDTACGACGGADLTGDANVDLDDLLVCAINWLLGVE